jgi:hypothetical protein
MGYGACKQLGYSRIGQSTNLNKGWPGAQVPDSDGFVRFPSTSNYQLIIFPYFPHVKFIGVQVTGANKGALPGQGTRLST